MDKFWVKNKKGLTLVELLVSVTMLSLAMTAVIGLFTTAVKDQARSMSAEQLINQTSYVAEYVSRALRMAKKDTDGACLEISNINYLKTLAGNGIRFLSYGDKCQEFKIDTETGKLQERKSSDEDKDNFGSWIDLTSGEVEVLSLNIGPDDSWSLGENQPRVTIYMKARGRKSSVKTEEEPEIEIQFTVSQRNLDI
jgi:prepilin-type N-terminal cleavage/methylation domain-containing protein